MPKYFFVVISILLAGSSASAQPYTIERDLVNEWLEYKDNVYRPVDPGSSSNTIYIRFKCASYPNKALRLKSSRPFFVFFDGLLVGEFQGIKNFDIDSLATTLHSQQVFIGIHQQKLNKYNFQTVVMSKKETPPAIPLLKPRAFFKDFVILAGLIIIVLFVVIVRINPKLAADYLSFAKMFSLREGDDAQSSARLTSSSNIQFYVLSSMLLGFYLMIILRHLPSEYGLSQSFTSDSFFGSITQWLKVSLIVLSLFAVKIVIVFSLTRLFGLKGLARIHFFNWVRLLLIVFGAASIIVFVYFILQGLSSQFFFTFLVLVVGTLAGWTLLVFLKLNNKTEHSLFHLFSYICATEIIPLLFTIKVLFQ